MTLAGACYFGGEQTKAKTPLDGWEDGPLPQETPHPPPPRGRRTVDCRKQANDPPLSS